MTQDELAKLATSVMVSPEAKAAVAAGASLILVVAQGTRGEPGSVVQSSGLAPVASPVEVGRALIRAGTLAMTVAAGAPLCSCERCRTRGFSGDVH